MGLSFHCYGCASRSFLKRRRYSARLTENQNLNRHARAHQVARQTSGAWRMNSAFGV